MGTRLMSDVVFAVFQEEHTRPWQGVEPKAQTVNIIVIINTFND